MRWLVDNPSLCVRRVLDTMLCSSTVPKYRTCSHMHNHADQSTNCDVAIKISSQRNWNYSSMKLKRFRCDLLFALPFFAWNSRASLWFVNTSIFQKGFHSHKEISSVRFGKCYELLMGINHNNKLIIQPGY